MAIRRISNRFLQIGSSRYTNCTNSKGLESSGTTPLIRRYSFMPSNSMKLNCRYIDNRHISQIVSPVGKQSFNVDTLALVRKLEAQGVPTKQAEAITGASIQVLNDRLEDVSHCFVSKVEMQKIEIGQESNLSKFKSEVECSLSKFKSEVECSLSKFKSEVQSSQEHHFGMLQRENEKLRGDIEKMRSEFRGDIEKMRGEFRVDTEKMHSLLRNEIDKFTAGQRLDLNLEKGKIRDELAKQNTETSSLTNKLDREIYALKAHLEGAKYDVIKYCVGTLVSAAAVGLAVLRTLK